MDKVSPAVLMWELSNKGLNKPKSPKHQPADLVTKANLLLSVLSPLSLQSSAAARSRCSPRESRAYLDGEEKEERKAESREEQQNQTSLPTGQPCTLPYG